ncbi:MAG: GDYXXLXY domain-containing protein [Azospirillum sp.]|nr:GDYXXLXY domain-containing protein [Azospirillum sp.]
MQKYKVALALFSPISVLLFWVVFLAVKSLFLPEVTLKISGYDPRDLLGGHYIAYTIDWKKSDCTQFEDHKCPQKEFEKYAFKERWGKQYRYYIPEEYADELDSLFRINRKKHTFEIVYKYKRGIKPMAKQLLIDGLPWMETIKE